MKRSARVFKRLLGILTALVLFVTFSVAFLAVAELAVETTARVLPSYAREDIAPVLAKEEWSEEDYAFLYRQTGLGRPALDALKGQSDKLLEFQDALYYEGTLKHEMAAFTTPHDKLENYKAPIAPLENGDVIVSSSCHTFGWRNGHAAIVTHGDSHSILESVAPGVPSKISDTEWFCKASNFIVLRLKDATKEERAEIALWATEHLRNIPYSILVGFRYPKDQGENVAFTNCSHLVWQAFKHFGLDIDFDGGPFVTSRDIAKSPLFEVVQVYGFDPEKLW